MPLALNSGSGSGRPYIRFSPQANAWLKGGAEGPEEFEVKGAQFAIDVERIQLGWLTLGEGVRDWQPWPNNVRTKQPSPEAKAGFACLVYAPKTLGDEVYEFSSNSTASTRFIEALYNICESKFGEGKVPLVVITGSKPIKIGKGTSREIAFEITKWVDRPKALADAAVGEVNETPKEEPKKAPQMADADEF